MRRRLYYLLPDRSHAEDLVEELGVDSVSAEDIHAVTRDKTDITGIKDIHIAAENDWDYFVEWLLWRINLLIFFTALIAFIAILIWNPGVWLILPLVFMLGTFISGLMFVLRLPNVHLDEFKPALQHGEVLLMLDVPASDIEKVDHRIHRKHPEVITGGVCWHV